MKKLLITGCFLLVCIITSTKAQNVSREDLQNKKYSLYLHPESTPGWIEFRKDAPYTADALFKQQPDMFGMKGDDEMRILKTNTDLAGNKHYKYGQFYKGIRVEGIEHITHERNGKIHLANGYFVNDLQLNVSPDISSQRAIEIALANFPAEKYMWQDAEKENSFKTKKKDVNATLYPTPELLIVKKNVKGEMKADNYVLAYRMYVFAILPYIAEYVYVDAHSGEIIRTKSLDVTCNPSTIGTTFNGDQTVNTDYRTEDCGSGGDESTDYFSIDDCNPSTEIKSYYSASYGTFYYGDDWLICDNDNDWEDWVSGSNRMVLTTLWSVKRAYTYYVNNHGHYSFDGSDGLIDAFNNKTYFDDDDNPYCTNANYTNIIDNLNFGSGNDCEEGSSDDYNTLDIVGHEYTHGVIEYAHFDALDYSEESGALNESFADIFGEMVEYYVEGGTLSWLMAEDRGAIRSYSDPNDYGDPDTYLGDNWASLDGDDNGGVHTNSGVQNHMFYLLSEGGEGTNDHGVDYLVEGIGYDHARDIAWHAMMNYLNSDDGYLIARSAWIQSAIDLFGSCSQEVISVGQAFQAVGVTYYTSYDLAQMCGTYILSGFIDATYGIENSTLFFGGFIGDCVTTVNSTAIVTLESGYYVNLNPGFEAKSGCTFVAMIDECEVSEYDPDDLRTASEQTPETESEELSSINIYPNPANTEIKIEFDLADLSAVDITLFDISGRQIAIWKQNEILDAGNHNFEFNTSELLSGIYFCSIKTNDGISTNKFVIQH